ncbi:MULTISPECIES: VOC family protein [Heyndrickxia]|jgi:predicted enzyme related to lactoylglutathione lyase|uniref:VOC family protein n=1 Tax=Heyndrickxia TaxID=2837504 RepID=UPI001B13F7D8|nr:VOC family protein [Heyndrickxia oleronia]GIN39370.1 glyoxalase [Heyndrickxia oleronia]
MNRIAHFEMQVSNTEKTIEFYKNIFGWKIEPFGDYGYNFITTDEEGVEVTGGILPSPDGQARIINTIEVNNLEESLEKVQENGGETIYPKMALPGRGFVAYCQGPEGLLFGIFQPDKNAQ